MGRTVNNNSFMELLKPLWHNNMDKESQVAVRKRSCILVATADEKGHAAWLYWRVATEDPVDVPRVKFIADTDGSRYLVADSAAPLIDSWKERRVVLPENYEEQLEWEERWMNVVMSKGALEIPWMTPKRVVAPPPALPDGVPLSQRVPEGPPPLSIAPEADGAYRIPVSRTGSGATIFGKFKLKRGSGSVDLDNLPGVSSSSAWPASAFSLAASSSTSPQTARPALKRVKIEQDEKIKQDKMAEKAAELEQLRRALALSQAEFDSMGPAMKQENQDDPEFQDVIMRTAAFADETKMAPRSIEDSPVKAETRQTKRKKNLTSFADSQPQSQQCEESDALLRVCK